MCVLLGQVGTSSALPCTSSQGQLLRSWFLAPTLASPGNVGQVGWHWPWLAPPWEPLFPGPREAESQALACVCCSLEKEVLEGNLFEVQRQLTQLETRREQLEADGQALLLAKEALTGRWDP